MNRDVTASALTANTPGGAARRYDDKSPQSKDDSMSLTPSALTPSAYDGALKSQWGQLTQKSYLTANNVSGEGPNRTTASDNPLLNRLTTNIPQISNTNRTASDQMAHNTTTTSGGSHPAVVRNPSRSLQRDQELENALDSGNQTLEDEAHTHKTAPPLKIASL